jgi:hypothetical protein
MIRLECDEILQEGYSGPEFGRGLISHHRPNMIASMKRNEMNEAILLALSDEPFLLHVLYGR